MHYKQIDKKFNENGVVISILCVSLHFFALMVMSPIAQRSHAFDLSSGTPVNDNSGYGQKDDSVLSKEYCDSLSAQANSNSSLGCIKINEKLRTINEKKDTIGSNTKEKIPSGSKISADPKGSLKDASGGAKAGVDGLGQQRDALSEMQKKSLDDSLRDFQNAGKIASDHANDPTASPTQRAEAIQDLNRVGQLADKHSSGKSITPEDVRGANIDKVRDNLFLAMMEQRVQKKLEADQLRISEQLAQLTKIAATADERATNLDTVSPDGSGTSSLLKSSLSSKDLASSASKKAEAKLQAEGDHDKITEKTGDPSKADAKAATDATTAKLSKLRDSLKDRLRQKLAQADKKNLAGAADHFNGKLNGDLGKEDSKSAKDLGAGAEVVGAVLKDEPEEGSPAFSMASSETDAEVSRLVEGAERGPAGANDRSIQAADTISLFERVHVAHNQCLKQGCVK